MQQLFSILQLRSSYRTFFKIFSTTLKDSLKTELLTELIGLSCNIEEQIISSFCVWLRAYGHLVHN